uniref:Uncharacterized protein n=1 Tax=Anguilla anguilla TaxID=7936 RepID=A0A0E9XDM1_ANGAN
MLSFCAANEVSSSFIFIMSSTSRS